MRNPHPDFKLTEEETQVLIGSLLGDGNLTCIGINPYFRESHCLAQQEYLEWKVRELYRLGAKLTPLRVRKGGQEVVSFRTRSLPNLKPLWKAFYPSGKKVFPDQIWSLNSLGLAVWYQDDGSLQGRVAQLHTEGRSLSENKWLAEEFFPIQFSLNPIVSRKGPGHLGGAQRSYLLFRVDETEKLIEIVSPHIHPVMSYKINLPPRINNPGKLDPNELIRVNASLPRKQWDWLGAQAILSGVELGDIISEIIQAVRVKKSYEDFVKRVVHLSSIGG